MICLSNNLMAKVMQKTWLPADRELDLGHRRFLTPSPLSPITGTQALPTVPTPGAVPRMQPWESNAVLRPPGLNTPWVQMRLLYKLRLWRVGVVIYSSCGARVSPLIHYTCCLPTQRVCLALWSLPALRTWGPVSGLTQGTSQEVCEPTQLHMKQSWF